MKKLISLLIVAAMLLGMCAFAAAVISHNKISKLAC